MSEAITHFEWLAGHVQSRLVWRPQDRRREAMKDAMGADSDYVIVRKADLNLGKLMEPGSFIEYRPYEKERISIPKLMILAVFCFSVIYLIWR
jgi:hypothetical protein